MKERASLSELVKYIRNSPQIVHKKGISAVTGGLGPRVFEGGILNGDDAAVIPDGDGFLLFAAEGVLPSLVKSDPFFAGRSAVLANVNDIYSMGGRPLAVVDVISAQESAVASEIYRGIVDFSRRLQVPVVGGHTHLDAGPPSVSLAILGRAKKVITSFDARPGQSLALLYNPHGKWLSEYGFWNCLPGRSGPEQVGDLELLPLAAEAGFVTAGKDVSMSGIVGTALMMVEASGVGAEIDMDKVPVPEGVEPGRWLLAYNSFGFLLAVDDEHWENLLEMAVSRSLEFLRIGTVVEGSQLVLSEGGHSEVLWDWAQEPFLGFG
jgi:AIR synthase-related protein